MKHPYFFYCFCIIICIYENIRLHLKCKFIQMDYSNDHVKRLLKSELVKRGISTSDLVFLLNKRGLDETQSSVASKISRGTFSAAFFLQCLSVIGCTKFEMEDFKSNLSLVAEPNVEYKAKDNE